MQRCNDLSGSHMSSAIRHLLFLLLLFIPLLQAADNIGDPRKQTEMGRA